MDKKLYNLSKRIIGTKDTEIYISKGEIFDSIVIEYHPDNSIIEWEKWNIGEYDDVNVSITSEKIIDTFFKKEQKMTGEEICSDIRNILSHIKKENYSRIIQYTYLRMGENEIENYFTIKINFLEARDHEIPSKLLSILKTK